MYYVSDNLTNIKLLYLDNKNYSKKYNMYIKINNIIELNVSTFIANYIHDISNKFYDNDKILNKFISSFLIKKNSKYINMFL